MVIKKIINKIKERLGYPVMVIPQDEWQNKLVTLPDNSQKTIAQVIFIAGQYSEVRRMNQELTSKYENLLTELVDLKSTRKQTKSKSLSAINETQQIVLELIAKGKVTKDKYVEQLQEIKTCPINSKASAYRIIKELKELGYLGVQDSKFYVPNEILKNLKNLKN